MKKVVVTGGSKGIGFAIALRFALEGNQVIICSRNKKELEEAADAIRAKRAGGNVFSFPCDVSKEDEIGKLYLFIESHFGTIDILVNNAGIYVPGQTHNEHAGALEQMLDTNLFSAYRLTRLCIPGMIERGQGHLFNVCSTASIMPYVNGGSYCISKYALYGFTKVLREEMKPYGIKVTAVIPGATRTHSWQGTDLPESRFMQASDVAEAVYMATILSSGTVIEEIVMRPQEGDII